MFKDHFHKFTRYILLAGFLAGILAGMFRAFHIIWINCYLSQGLYGLVLETLRQCTLKYSCLFLVAFTFSGLLLFPFCKKILKDNKRIISFIFLLTGGMTMYSVLNYRRTVQFLEPLVKSFTNIFTGEFPVRSIALYLMDNGFMTDSHVQTDYIFWFIVFFFLSWVLSNPASYLFKGLPSFQFQVDTSGYIPRLLNYFITKLFGLYKLTITITHTFLLSRTGLITGIFLAILLTGWNMYVYSFIGNSPELPNILLISIDTIRSDHLGAYGYPRKTSANISWFAKRSITFPETISSATWTLPSYASLMTSLSPTIHGCANFENRLEPGFTTITELLKNKGYFTKALVNSLFISKVYGLEQGFDEFTVYTDPRIEGNTSLLLRDTDFFLSRNYRIPFFLFLHLSDPHFPYIKEAPITNIFKKNINIDGITWNTLLNFVEYQQQGLSFNSDQLDFMKALYDSEIFYVDMYIGRIMKLLHELGLFDNTLIVITGDHGEEFLDHGMVGHGNLPYEELIRIPLFIKLPGTHSLSGIIPNQVRLIDIAPTILNIVGISPGLHFHGRTLLPSITNRPVEVPATEPAVTEKSLSTLNYLSLRKPPYKYIVSWHKDIPGVQEQLFNIQLDPAELNNIIRDDIDGARQSHEILKKFLVTQVSLKKKLSKVKIVHWSPQVKQKMESLGYVME